MKHQEKKHLSGKRHKEPRELLSKELPSKRKEIKLQSLPLDKLVQKEQPLKESGLFINRIYKLLSTKEASGFLGVSENTLRILVCRKKIKAYKLGGRLRFKLEDLADCLQQKEV